MVRRCMRRSSSMSSKFTSQKDVRRQCRGVGGAWQPLRTFVHTCRRDTVGGIAPRYWLALVSPRTSTPHASPTHLVCLVDECRWQRESQGLGVLQIDEVLNRHGAIR